MKQTSIILVILSMFLFSCQKKSMVNEELIESEVLKVVKAHNHAWTVVEDLEVQKKYVHKNIVFISPPFKEIKTGISEYMADYKVWMDHATVHKFKEIDPVVTLYNQGKFALVTYKIEMAFEYDENKVPEWKGVDHMTLVYENGNWLITSDMFGKSENNE